MVSPSELEPALHLRRRRRKRRKKTILRTSGLYCGRRVIGVEAAARE